MIPFSPTFAATGSLVDWARIFTAVDVWRPAVEEICRRHDLGPADELTAGYPGSNAVFIVARRWVVKIAWPFDRTGFHREVELLRRLEPYRDILLTPRLLAQGVLEGQPDWPYCVMERLPGARLGDVWPELGRADRLALAGQLGRWVRALHAVPLTPLFETLDVSREAWGHWVAERTIHCAAELRARDGLPAHLLAQLPVYLERAQPLYPTDVAPVLLNGDVTEDHALLFCADGCWRISGYIDFDDALAGHAEYEFTTVHLAVFDCDAELTRAFLEAYGWDGWQQERFSRRMMAYCLLHPWFNFSAWIDRLGGAERVASLEQLEAALWPVWR